MKIFTVIIALLFLSSCNSVYKQEMEKTVKSGAASSRINSSAQSNDSLFDEID